MTDVVTIPMRPLAALLFAALMSLHAGVLAALLADDIPTEGHEVLGILAGWLWWAFLLWMGVSA